MVGPLVSRAKHEIAFALTLSLLRLGNGSPRAERQTLCALLPPRRALSSSSRRLASPLATRAEYAGRSGVLNTEFSRFKNFPIHEAMKLRLRAEFFNAFNRPQRGTPDGTMTLIPTSCRPSRFFLSVFCRTPPAGGGCKSPSGHS